MSTFGTRSNGSCVVLAGLLLLLVAGCTTTRMDPVDSRNDQVVSQLRVGDYVRIWTEDGAWLEMQVASVSSEFVSGSGEQVPVSSIDRVERREVDGWASAQRTGSVAGGVVIGILFFALLFFAGG